MANFVGKISANLQTGRLTFYGAVIDGDDYTRDSVEHIQMVEVAEGIHLRVNEDMMTADYPVNLSVLKTHTQIKVNLGL